jgi:hypothetical protein
MATKSATGKEVNGRANGRPETLRPEALAKAKEIEVEPVVREQLIPEKGDHRFMDRWPLVWARTLGERVIRARGLERLQQGVGELGEWRALSNEVKLREHGIEDAVDIATAESRVEAEKGRAERCNERAKVEDDVADGFKEVAENADAERMQLVPALRGAAFDAWLWVIAQFVLLTVDVFVLHQALELTPGTDLEHWLTSSLIGAGVVVVGDVLGWGFGASMIKHKGVVEAPRERAAMPLVLVTLLAIWFFVALGTFRGESLETLAKLDELTIPRPGFFALAQILFFVGSAGACFSFIARQEGRRFLRLGKEAAAEERKYRGKANQLREQAEQALKAVGEAPIRRKAAEARRAERQAAAEAQAKMDRQQAKYLKPLLETEYLARRGEVESGLRYWTLEQTRRITTRVELLGWILHPGLTLSVLAAAAVWVATHNGAVAGTVGLSVLVAMAMVRMFATPASSPELEPNAEPTDFFAEVREGALPEDDSRASEIERLVQRPRPNGNQHGEEESSHES